MYRIQISTLSFLNCASRKKALKSVWVSVSSSIKLLEFYLAGLLVKRHELMYVNCLVHRHTINCNIVIITPVHYG